MADIRKTRRKQLRDSFNISMQAAIKIDHILNEDEYKEEKKLLEQLAFAV